MMAGSGSTTPTTRFKQHTTRLPGPAVESCGIRKLTLSRGSSTAPRIWKLLRCSSISMKPGQRELVTSPLGKSLQRCAMARQP